MNQTIPTSFLEDLRQATSQSHKDLESLSISASIIDPNVTKSEYIFYLSLMHDVVADTEENIFPLLEGIVPDLKQRVKSNLIDADLKALISERTATHQRPITRNLKEIAPAFALGIMYVVEGSSLGGRVILKNITSALGYDAGNGAAYFAGYGGQTGSYWKNFLTAMAEYEANNQCADEVIEGANFAFNAINSHFKGSAPQ